MSIIRPYIPAPTWFADAACREHDPDVFSPPGFPREDSHEWDLARAVCRTCPVATLCREHAIATDERWGYWNSTPQERERAREEGAA